MPMHPSNTYTIHELQANAKDILHLVQEEANKQIKGAKMNLDSKYHDGAVWVDQGEIAGCAGGTFDNICAAADILRGKSCGNGAFTLSIYPGSMPALAELIQQWPRLRPGGRRCHHARVLLRSLLRRRRLPGQRRVLHPPHHPQLPQP